MSVEPQYAKEKKEILEKELISKIININGDYYINIGTAITFLRKSFNLGFKIARRDRTSLAEHLIREIDKKFNVSLKD